MRIYRHFSGVSEADRGTVVALGNFDGLHRGHQAVIGKAKALAREKNVPLAVMTFEPHPRAFFTPNQDAFDVVVVVMVFSVLIIRSTLLMFTVFSLFLY